MKQFVTTLVVTLCLVHTNTFAQDALPSSAKAIDTYFKKLEAFGLSGSLLIGNKEGIIFKNNYGNEEATLNSMPAYSIASIMKQFTAVAILTLEQRGLLNTNDKIDDHLSNVPTDKSEITIHQLLTHTSGLRNAYWDNKEYRDLSFSQFIAKVLEKDLEYKPGTTFSYSNFGYDILAKIIELKTGKPRIQFLVEDIFKPNGMRYTGNKSIKWKKGQVAQYMDWPVSNTDLKLSSNPLSWPFTVTLSTVEDMYKWYQLIFHSNKLLTEKSKQKLLKVEKDNYAYGWNVRKTIRGTQLIYHGGYDSWLGMVTGFYHFVEEDLVVIFLGNTNMNETLRHENIMQEVESIVFGGYTKFPPSSPYKASAVNLEKHFGKYQIGNSSANISAGKISNQIKLRTTDTKLIRNLLFPDEEKWASEKDDQLEFTIDHINRNDFEPLKDVFFEGLFDRFKVQYSSVWNQLKAGYGKYKSMKILHKRPYFYQGELEIQIFMELKFENGPFLLRATRIPNGRIALHPYYIPERFEAFLIPIGENEFMTWNIKYETTAFLQFKQDGFLVNSDPHAVYKKM